MRPPILNDVLTPLAIHLYPALFGHNDSACLLAGFSRISVSVSMFNDSDVVLKNSRLEPPKLAPESPEFDALEEVDIPQSNQQQRSNKLHKAEFQRIPR